MSKDLFKDRSCQRLLKSKLTEKHNNPLLLVTVEQDGGIKIFSLVSLESQPVSNFVDETIILKQAAVVSTEYVNIFVEKKSGVYWQPTINKLRNDSRRSNRDFSEVLLIYYNH